MADGKLDTKVLQKNLARLLVRRHLRSWIGRHPWLSEDDLIALFTAATETYPKLPMKDVVRLVEISAERLADIGLGVRDKDLYEPE